MSMLWMLAVTIGVLQTSVFFTTIYLHRYLTHGGLQLHPGVANLMHLELALFTAIVPREWVAVHRKHHQFSDEEGDPHSPYLKGLWHVLFLNAWYYRCEARNPGTIERYTPHWKHDLLDRWPRLSKLCPVVGIVLMAVAFGLLPGVGFWTGTALGVVGWLVQAIVYIFLNSMINGLCHMVGYRNFDNLATNLQSVALLTGGEGLHNNHHESPTGACLARKPGEIDPAWPVIRLLGKLGLAEIKRFPWVKTEAA